MVILYHAPISQLVRRMIIIRLRIENIMLRIFSVCAGRWVYTIYFQFYFILRSLLL